jgi:hypothetical protein
MSPFSNGGFGAWDREIQATGAIALVFVRTIAYLPKPVKEDSSCERMNANRFHGERCGQNDNDLNQRSLRRHSTTQIILATLAPDSGERNFYEICRALPLTHAPTEWRPTHAPSTSGSDSPEGGAPEIELLRR